MKNVVQQQGETGPAYLTRCARVAGILATADRTWTGGWVIETVPTTSARCAGETDWSDQPEVVHETFDSVEETVGWMLYVDDANASRRPSLARSAGGAL